MAERDPRTAAAEAGAERPKGVYAPTPTMQTGYLPSLIASFHRTHAAKKLPSPGNGRRSPHPPGRPTRGWRSDVCLLPDHRHVQLVGLVLAGQAGVPDHDNPGPVRF